jgi:hypothetical protein
MSWFKIHQISKWYTHTDILRDFKGLKHEFWVHSKEFKSNSSNETHCSSLLPGV